jgi:hypothetical protein
VSGVEGLTIPEAANESRLVGAYGKPVSKQRYAPLGSRCRSLRFKSIKSIVRLPPINGRRVIGRGLQASDRPLGEQSAVAIRALEKATEELIG